MSVIPESLYAPCQLPPVTLCGGGAEKRIFPPHRLVWCGYPHTPSMTLWPYALAGRIQLRAVSNRYHGKRSNIPSISSILKLQKSRRPKIYASSSPLNCFNAEL